MLDFGYPCGGATRGTKTVSNSSPFAACAVSNCTASVVSSSNSASTGSCVSMSGVYILFLPSSSSRSSQYAMNARRSPGSSRRSARSAANRINPTTEETRAARARASSSSAWITPVLRTISPITSVAGLVADSSRSADHVSPNRWSTARVCGSFISSGSSAAPSPAAHVANGSTLSVPSTRDCRARYR